MDSNDMNPPIPAALPTPAPTPVARTGTTVAAAPKPNAPTVTGAIPGEALVLAVLIGFAAAGAAAALRKKFLSGAKGNAATLLGCDLCITFWLSAVLTGLWWYASGLPFVPAAGLFFGVTWLASIGIGLLALKAAGRLTDPFSPIGIEDKTLD